MLKRLLFTALAALCLGASFASAADVPQERFQGFVKLANGREVYVDFLKPAAGKPIAAPWNGLTYDISSWNRFTDELKGDGLGILRWDPYGMGRTLLKYGTPLQAIDYRDQVNDFNLLLDALGITQPIHIVGLSYGGALALQYGHVHPERVASLIIMAPFVAPLEAQDNLIKWQIVQTRLQFPWNRASDDELYDYFLRIQIMTTYPAAEPVILDNPYKLEATFRMVQGIRKFLAKDITKFEPNVGVHLVVGAKDQYIENKVHEDFWKLLQPGTQKSLMYISETEHKIPEAAPRFSALWVRNIIAGNSEIGGGQTYTGNPRTNEVKTGNKSFYLTRTNAGSSPTGKLWSVDYEEPGYRCRRAFPD